MRLTLANRIVRPGLQRRIMLYVVAGLALMFGAIVVLGLGAISRATDLVYQERLATAFTTAGILDRDFARVASDVLETAQEDGTVTGGIHPGAASDLLDHLDRPDPYAFFSATGVWLLDASGTIVDDAGSPPPPAGSAARTDTATAAAASGSAAMATPTLIRSLAAGLRGSYAVWQALGPVPGRTPFAAIAVRLGSSDATTGPIAVVDTVSLDRATEFVPASYGSAGPASSTAAGAGATAEGYHLEVVDRQGIAVLGIGPDEVPGTPSKHFPVIRTLMASGAAAAQLHEPGPGDRFDPHVMAVVPLAGTPFYVVLEQPLDVALALPNELRDQLLLVAGLGFLAALVVAWVTTRRVVKPTEELTAAAERMAGGDLASPIDVSAQDEVARLAESLEAMRRRLREATEAAERTNRELERRVAERTSRLGQLLRGTISAQEEERRRLARELHDETAQTLAALSISLDRARDALGGAPPATLERVNEARAISTRLLAETRRLIMGLRPAVLDDMGLLPAIRWYADTALADAGVEVSVEADPSMPRLPPHMEVALFRIAQEAMTNVAKHAAARHARIDVHLNGSDVTVRISDDGRGFDVAGALGHDGPDDESVGLVGMQERVRLLNGRLEITSEPGRGTTVLVSAPVEEASE